MHPSVRTFQGRKPTLAKGVYIDPAATVNPVNGIASVTFTPTSAGSATVTTSATGLTGDTASLSVSTAISQTLFSSETPANPDASDNGTDYELGMKFQAARAGRITEEPRELLRAFCRDFVEMTPNRTENYCCGGGGGTVSIDEIRAFRTGPLGKRKADQIRDTGAHYLVAPCANCKKQLREVCQDNGLDDVEVVGVHDLLLKVIDFSKGA